MRSDLSDSSTSTPEIALSTPEMINRMPEVPPPRGADVWFDGPSHATRPYLG